MGAAAKIVEMPKPEKNPAAVALGRLGGLKGGKARAEKLSPDERKAIAQQAAKRRWAKVKSDVVETRVDRTLESLKR